MSRITPADTAAVQSLAQWLVGGGGSLGVVATAGFVTDHYGVWVYVVCCAGAGLLCLAGLWLWAVLPELVTRPPDEQPE